MIAMKNLRLSTRLNLGFVLVIALFLLLAAITAWRMGRVSEATARMELEAFQRAHPDAVKPA